MVDLSPPECRALGVLVEKALTTPAQYPLTLNGLTNGCNQKSNREPVLTLSEDDALLALDGLRAKGLAREVMLSGSRVEKFKHNARETLAVSTAELVVLVELMLRGPQTVGEIRGRASRMHPLESIEVVAGILETLMNREPPMIMRLPGGGRAPRYAQLLGPPPAPEANQVASPAHSATSTPAPDPTRPSPSPDLVNRLRALEREVADLRQNFERLAGELGVAISSSSAENNPGTAAPTSAGFSPPG